MATKLINGIRINLTAEEIAAKQAEETAWTNGKFDRVMYQLRTKRNALLAKTDWTSGSDITMSSEMTTYRQALRDITNGVTTVAQAEAVVFPDEVTQ